MPFRKISKCHQDVVNVIYKAAGILKFHEFEYSIKMGGEDIDAFYTGIYTVQISGLKFGQKITQTVVVKRHPDSDTRSALREAYRRETTFYCRTVPRYLEIQQSFKIIEGLRIKFPNCVFASDEYDMETIVIMGVLEDGFTFCDRFRKIDLNHATLVIKYLAKLHALSFILEKINPEEFERIKALCGRDVQYSDPTRQSESMKRFYEASVSVVSDSTAQKKLKELTPNILSLLHKCTLPAPGYSAICHADCWNNNILFKIKDKKPVDIILIDYQLMRFASPVTDIAYFLYMSTTREFLSKHYETVLNIYYGTLAAVLRECNLNVKEIYPKKIFESQLREYSVLGLVEALISMMIITAPFEEALKMTEIKHQFCNEGFCESTDSILFKQRVNDIVDDFFSRGYSLDAVLNK